MRMTLRVAGAATDLVVSAAARVQALVATPMDGSVCWLDASSREIADYAVAHHYITTELQYRVREDVTSAAALSELEDVDAGAFAFDPALPPEEVFGEG